LKTLDDILNEWDKDAPIDRTEPAKELARIPILLGKYLRALKDHKIKARKFTYDYKELKRVKKEYYMGKSSKEVLAEKGWEQFPLKLLRGEESDYIDSDADLNKLNIRIQYHDEIADTAERIIKELNNRSWQLRGIIQWETYSRGVG